MWRRGGSSAGALGALALAMLAWAAPAAAQTGGQPGPAIEELRRLVSDRETQIARAEPRLSRLEAQQDSLVSAKRRTRPGSARFEAVSNRIHQLAGEIQRLQRDLQIHRQALRDLRTRLYIRYNISIGETNQRYEELKRQGYTPQTSEEMRRLIERFTEYQRAREELPGLIEEVQTELALPSLAYDPTDDPRELRLKVAAARDAIAAIDSMIGRIEGQIDEIEDAQRMRREARQVQRDLEFWGDDRSAQSADELGQILEQTGPDGIRAIGVDPFTDTEERIRRLRERRAELLERRVEYARKVDLFDRQLREFYR